MVRRMDAGPRRAVGDGPGTLECWTGWKTRSTGWTSLPGCLRSLRVSRRSLRRRCFVGW